MHLGLSTYTFPWEVGVPGFIPESPMSAFALLHKATEYGIHSVQFGDNLPLHLLSEEERHAIAETAQTSGLHLEVGTRRLTYENISRYLTIASQMQSPFLRVVIDDADFHPDENQVVQTIQQLLPELLRSEIILAIENHDRFPATSLEHIIQATDPDWVGICLDTANSLGAGEGIREIVEVLAPYTVNLHIKDFTIKRVSHKMGFEVTGCAAGKGVLDIPWLISALEAYQRCQTATLEVWSNPKTNIDATLVQEASWVKESIHYLKQYLT